MASQSWGRHARGQGQALQAGLVDLDQALQHRLMGRSGQGGGQCRRQHGKGEAADAQRSSVALACSRIACHSLVRTDCV